MTLAHKTKYSALIVALLVAAATMLLPPTTASANAPAAFAVEGTAHLSAGIGATGDPAGCFGGSAVGIHGTDTALPDALFPGANPAYAGFTYNNPNTALGDADGNLEVTLDNGSTVEEHFVWNRVGVAAVILFDGAKNNHIGVGVALFAPNEPGADACSTRGDKNFSHGSWADDAHAIVVGAGVLVAAPA